MPKSVRKRAVIALPGSPGMVIDSVNKMIPRITAPTGHASNFKTSVRAFEFQFKTVYPYVFR